MKYSAPGPESSHAPSLEYDTPLKMHASSQISASGGGDGGGSEDRGVGPSTQHPLQLHPYVSSSEQAVIMKSPHVRLRHELEHWTGAEGGATGGGGGGGGGGGMQQPEQSQPSNAVMTSQFRSW